MAKIAGLGNDSWDSTTGLIPANMAIAFLGGYQATDSVTVNELFARIDSVTTATDVVIGIFDSSGNLLEQTSGITLPTLPATISASVTDVSITSGQTYYLFAMANGYFMLGSDSTNGINQMIKDATSTYSTFPDPIALDDIGSSEEPCIWAEGAAGASIIPQAAHHSNIILG